MAWYQIEFLTRKLCKEMYVQCILVFNYNVWFSKKYLLLTPIANILSKEFIQKNFVISICNWIFRKWFSRKFLHIFFPFSFKLVHWVFKNCMRPLYSLLFCYFRKKCLQNMYDEFLWTTIRVMLKNNLIPKWATRMYSSRNSIIKKIEKRIFSKEKRIQWFQWIDSLYLRKKITESILAWPVLFCLVIAIYLGGSNWTLLQVSCKYSVCVCVCLYAFVSKTIIGFHFCCLLCLILRYWSWK